MKRKRARNNPHDIHIMTYTEIQRAQMLEKNPRGIKTLKWAIWDGNEKRLVDKKIFDSFRTANKRAENLNQKYGCVRYCVVVGY